MSLNLNRKEEFLNLLNSSQKNYIDERPVTQFLTNESNLYNFNFKSSSKNANGNTLIFGRSGSGKTTLISFLLANCLKYNDIKILAFDCLNNLKIMTETFNESYFDYSTDTIKINPFILDNTSKNKNFLYNWLCNLAEIDNINDKKQILDIINLVYLANKDKLKNLEMFAEGLKSNKNIYNSLINYGKESEKFESKFFSSKDLNKIFNNKLNVFEVRNFIKDTKIFNNFIHYVFYYFSNISNQNNSPHLIYIEDAYRYLDNDFFMNELEKTLHNINNNGSLIMSFINVLDFTESPILNKLFDKFETKIFFPNHIARVYNDKYLSLGLTEKDINWMLNCKKEYQVLVKQNNQDSVIIDVDLNDLEKYLQIFSSTGVSDIKKLSLLKENYNESWLEHLE